MPVGIEDGISESHDSHHVQDGAHGGKDGACWRSDSTLVKPQMQISLVLTQLFANRVMRKSDEFTGVAHVAAFVRSCSGVFRFRVPGTAVAIIMVV
jgi:hypothetical protein